MRIFARSANALPPGNPAVCARRDDGYERKPGKTDRHMIALLRENARMALAAHYG